MNIFVADSMKVPSFVFAQLSPKAKQKSLVKPDDENIFQQKKWHFKVIQGQAFYGCWKADKALHDAT